MSRRHNRHRKKERRTRNKQAEADFFAPRATRAEPADDQQPAVRKVFSFGVRGGWSMEFVTSGVRVPFDPEATEAPPLVELTLGDVLRDDSSEGEA